MAAADTVQAGRQAAPAMRRCSKSARRTVLWHAGSAPALHGNNARVDQHNPATASALARAAAATWLCPNVPRAMSFCR